MRFDSRRRQLGPGPTIGCLAVAMALLLAAPVAAHETGRKLTDDELVARSSNIVRGRVTNLRSEWSLDGTHIYTFVDIRVDESLKRSIPGNRLTLRLLGGAVGEIAMTVLGTPEFERDEEVLLFLEKNTRSFFPTVGRHEGKLTVATDAQTGGKRVEASHRPSETLQNFRSRITGLVASQAARQSAGGGFTPSTAP